MESFVTTQSHPGGYAVVTIAREPVNSMNLDLWRQLTDALVKLEDDPAVRGVVFTSGLKKDVFTAGNDLSELYVPATTQERHRAFWITQNSFLARLYASPLLSVAAVRGACPAGGCVLALACDLRLMTDNGSIGLNEVALGLPVPEYWAKLMMRTIGQRQAEQLLFFGQMASPQQALAMGIVHQVVAPGELVAAADQAMLGGLKAPDAGRAATKLNLRHEFAKAWTAFAPNEADESWELLSRPATQQALAGVLQRLSKK